MFGVLGLYNFGHNQKIRNSCMEKVSMSLMEEPIAVSGAYFVFLYILVTVPDRIVAGYSLSQPIFSVH